MCFSFYTQTVVSSTGALDQTVFISGVVKKQTERKDLRTLCSENVLTSCVALFLIYVEMFDRSLVVFLALLKYQKQAEVRFVIVQLVYVKRLCSLTFI